MVNVFGTVCLDRVRCVARMPKKGGYTEILDELDLLGGEAANTSVALRGWGAEVVLVGNSIGKGPEADLLVKRLGEAGLGGARLTSSNHETPYCDIYVTPDGERTMFGRGFASLDRRIDPDQAQYIAGEWFTADPNPGDASRAAVRMAAEAGMRVYLLDFIREDDPVESDAGTPFWQSSTDWAGVRSNTQKNIQWVQRFVERHGCFAILSDGPNGFVTGAPDRPVRHYPPYPCAEPVDSTGAGDIFRAGMLFGLDQAWPIADCLRFASAAGCLNCLGLGASAMVPSRDAIEQLIRANPTVSGQYE